MNNKLQAQIVENATVIDSGHGNVISNEDHDFSALNAVNDEKVYEAAKKDHGLLKNIGLFFASPFIALAYVVALPVVGIFMFARLAREARSQNSGVRVS